MGSRLATVRCAQVSFRDFVSADHESDVFTEYVCAPYSNIETTLRGIAHSSDGLVVADRPGPRARTLRLALSKIQSRAASFGPTSKRNTKIDTSASYGSKGRAAVHRPFDQREQLAINLVVVDTWRFESSFAREPQKAQHREGREHGCLAWVLTLVLFSEKEGDEDACRRWKKNTTLDAHETLGLLS
jgi:hypothetical protein